MSKLRRLPNGQCKIASKNEKNISIMNMKIFYIHIQERFNGTPKTEKR